MERIQKHLQQLALYAACLMEEKGKVSQTRIAQAGNISVVTLRKRVWDISKVFPEINKSK